MVSLSSGVFSVVVCRLYDLPPFSLIRFCSWTHWVSTVRKIYMRVWDLGTVLFSFITITFYCIIRAQSHIEGIVMFQEVTFNSVPQMRDYTLSNVWISHIMQEVLKVYRWSRIKFKPVNKTNSHRYIRVASALSNLKLEFRCSWREAFEDRTDDRFHKSFLTKSFLPKSFPNYRFPQMPLNFYFQHKKNLMNKL